MCLGVVGTMCSGGLHSGASSVPSARPPQFLLLQLGMHGLSPHWLILKLWSCLPCLPGAESPLGPRPAQGGHLQHQSALCSLGVWARQQILCLPPQSFPSHLSITAPPPLAELCSSPPHGLCHPHHSALVLSSTPPAPFLAAVTPREDPPPAVTPAGLCPPPCLTSHFAPQCAWLGPSLPLSDFGKGGEKHHRKVGGIRGAPLLSASKLSSGAGRGGDNDFPRARWENPRTLGRHGLLLFSSNPWPQIIKTPEGHFTVEHPLLLLQEPQPGLHHLALEETEQS